MTVGRICQREVDLAERDESVTIAAQRMGARDVGTLVILDDDRCPVGIVTDRDLVVCVLGKKKDPDETLVGEVMSRNPETVSESTSIEDALGRMRDQGVRRLPVVDFEGRLEGMVSLDDILGLIVEEFDELGGDLPPTRPTQFSWVLYELRCLCLCGLLA